MLRKENKNSKLFSKSCKYLLRKLGQDFCNFLERDGLKNEFIIQMFTLLTDQTPFPL